MNKHRKVFRGSRRSGRFVGAILGGAVAGYALLGHAPSAQADWKSPGAGNPVVPGYFADPSLHLFDGTYYLYSTTDGYGWDCGPSTLWKSKDLVSWTNEPLTISPKPDVYWAPSVVHVNGKYYMYYSKKQKGSWVSESTSPEGPFTELGQVSGSKEIDAQPFVDDDGSVYLYYGGSNIPHVGKLNPDMKSFEKKVDLSVGRFGEGSFVFKRDGKYYLMTSLGYCADGTYSVAYSTSTSPYGPFSGGGSVLRTSQDDTVNGPGHNSVLVANGRYFMVYHRHDNPHSEDGLHRQVCIDEMSFNADGTIKGMVPTHEGVGALPLAGATSRPNLASGKTATSSGEKAGFSAAYAIDQNNGTRWAASASSVPQWLQVDLGAPTDVKATQTVFEFIAKKTGFKIETSTDGTSWSPYSDHTGGKAVTGTTLDEVAVTARYFKVTITSLADTKNAASIPEFKILGGASSTPVPPGGNVADGGVTGPQRDGGLASIDAGASGGSGGAGGSTGGGTPGSGGSGGASGGSAGVGGTVSNGGGSAGSGQAGTATAGGSPSDSPRGNGEQDSGGCAVRAPGGGSSDRWGALLAAVGVAVAVGRRKRLAASR